MVWLVFVVVCLLGFVFVLKPTYLLKKDKVGEVTTYTKMQYLFVGRWLLKPIGTGKETK